MQRFNEAGAARPRKSLSAYRPLPPSCRFNEAGAARPRKSYRLRKHPPENMGFNEAGAARPRKSTWPTRSISKRTRFNEAGAARPRKYDDRAAFAVAGNASMRPGPHGPGNKFRFNEAAPAGNSFNEAGAARPRKSLKRAIVEMWMLTASMRPGPHGPGNLRRDLNARRAHSASMRPGPHGPGNYYQRAAQTPSDAPASMRPGPHGPGNTPKARRIYVKTSTGFNEAGAARPRKFSEFSGRSGSYAKLQ